MIFRCYGRTRLRTGPFAPEANADAGWKLLAGNVTLTGSVAVALMAQSPWMLPFSVLSKLGRRVTVLRDGRLCKEAMVTGSATVTFALCRAVGVID